MMGEGAIAPEHTVYDLQGRRVNSRLTKGIYLIGGHKVLVK